MAHKRAALWVEVEEMALPFCKKARPLQPQQQQMNAYPPACWPKPSMHEPADAEMMLDAMPAPPAQCMPMGASMCPPCFAHRFCRPGICNAITPGVRATSVQDDYMQF